MAHLQGELAALVDRFGDGAGDAAELIASASHAPGGLGVAIGDVAGEPAQRQADHHQPGQGQGDRRR